MTFVFNLLRSFGWFLAALTALLLVSAMLVNEFHPGGLKDLLKNVENELDDEIKEARIREKDAERRRRFFRK